MSAYRYIFIIYDLISFSEDRSSDDTDDIGNILEAYLMQVSNMLSSAESHDFSIIMSFPEPQIGPGVNILFGYTVVDTRSIHFSYLIKNCIRHTKIHIRVSYRNLFIWGRITEDCAKANYHSSAAFRKVAKGGQNRYLLK